MTLNRSEKIPVWVWLVIALVVLVILFLGFLLSAAVFQLIWNHGVTHAFNTHAISYWTSFALVWGITQVGALWSYQERVGKAIKESYKK